MKLLNEKKYKFQCRKCHTEILFSKEDCWVDKTYEDLWLTCPVCGRGHDNQTYRLFRQEYIEEHDDKDKEIERLNNIINKIEEHFVFLKMNSTGGNKEFFEDILDFIKELNKNPNEYEYEYCYECDY